MKKLHILFLFFALVPAAASAQWFAQGGFGIDLVNFSPLENNYKGGKTLNFQIGKFVSHYKMRTFTVNLDFGMKASEDFQIGLYNSGTGTNTTYNTKRLLKVRVFSIGYERKVTFADTEFDDVWNFYTILNYNLAFSKFKDELEDADLNKLYQDGTVSGESYTGNYVDLEIGIGLGMARKFEKSTYVYTDIKAVSPLLFNIERLPIQLQFGVRRPL